MGDGGLMAGERILCVDDDQSVLKMVTSFLARRGYQVAAASDGLQALQLVGSTDPQLIITDVSMPHVDGMELTKRLRANHRTARIPIIMLSGQRAVEDILAGYAEGADEYVAKPIDMAVLAAKVETLLRRTAGAAESEAQPGKVLAFVHAKGGVGTSSLAVNMAVALAGMGLYRVVLFDANPEFGNVAPLLNLEPAITLSDLYGARITEVDERDYSRALLQHGTGLRVLSSTNRPEKAAYLSVAGVQQALGLLRQDADYLIVDTPVSFSEINLAILDASDLVCLVTVPRVVALKGTIEYLATLERIGFDEDRVSVILNRPAPTGLDKATIEEFLGHRIEAEIPYSASFDEAADRGIPVVLSHAGKAGAVESADLAGRLTAKVLSSPPGVGPLRA
jgi:pilus assembly protein CpaE